ncbi:MAG: hypothetical protein ACT4OX_11405 [Actinomycetota bacterium]
MQKLAAAVLAAALALGATACSGDDDDATTAVDDGSEDGDGGGGGGDEGGGDSDSDFCQLSRQHDEQFAANDAETVSEEELEAFDALVEVAPGEIRDAVAAGRDFLRDLAAAGDDAAAVGALFERVGSDPELTAAFTEFETYLSDVCGIDTGTDTGTVEE